MINENEKNARFSTRTKILLLILLVALVLILHYPMSFNEIGFDSVAIHVLANSVSEFGYAKWWLHPLSVFGMYPYGGIAGAVIFLLSGTSQLTGLASDVNIFWSSLILGIFSIFTAYLMAGEIFDNDTYKFLVALGYSTSQGILFYTTWTAGSRALFIVVLPLFIYLLLKSNKSIKYGLLAAISFLFLLSTHKMIYFTLPLIFTILMMPLILKLISRLTSEKKSGISNLFFIFAFMVTFSIPFITRIFMETTSRYQSLILLFTTYVRYNGIAVLFLISGYLYIIMNKSKNRGNHFLIISLIFIAPLLYMTNYMKWFILPYIYSFAGIGFWNVFKNGKTLKIGPLIIIGLVIFSGYYQYMHFYNEPSQWEQYRYFDKSEYKTGMWVKEHIPSDYVTVGNSISSTRIFAVSNVSTLLGESAALVYNFLDKNKLSITRIPLTDMSAYLDSPYVSTLRPKIEWYSETIFYYYPLGDYHTVEAINQFNLSYMIENRIFGSKFTFSLPDKSECYYDNGQIRIWDLKKWHYSN